MSRFGTFRADLPGLIVSANGGVCIHCITCVCCLGVPTMQKVSIKIPLWLYIRQAHALIYTSFHFASGIYYMHECCACACACVCHACQVV